MRRKKKKSSKQNPETRDTINVSRGSIIVNIKVGDTGDKESKISHSGRQSNSPTLLSMVLKLAQGARKGLFWLWS
ncbi:MAG: hypothetical protein ACYS30_18330 [Planctomycetota bacterium]